MGEIQPLRTDATGRLRAGEPSDIWNGAERPALPETDDRAGGARPTKADVAGSVMPGSRKKQGE